MRLTNSLNWGKGGQREEISRFPILLYICKNVKKEEIFWFEEQSQQCFCNMKKCTLILSNYVQQSALHIKCVCVVGWMPNHLLLNPTTTTTQILFMVAKRHHYHGYNIIIKSSSQTQLTYKLMFCPIFGFLYKVQIIITQ